MTQHQDANSADSAEICAHAIEHDRWMTDPADRDYLAPADRWCRVCGKPDSEHVSPQLSRYNSPNYSFERDGDLVRVYVREGCRHLDTFRMPRDCRTLMQFAAAFFSYRDLGAYKVTA